MAVLDRDLQQLLGYANAASEHEPANHFAGAGKLVEFGSGGAREVEDVPLSRFGRHTVRLGSRAGRRSWPGQTVMLSSEVTIQLRRASPNAPAARGILWA